MTKFFGEAGVNDGAAALTLAETAVRSVGSH
jgi:hypothetical protein